MVVFDVEGTEGSGVLYENFGGGCPQRFDAFLTLKKAIPSIEIQVRKGASLF